MKNTTSIEETEYFLCGQVCVFLYCYTTSVQESI